MGVFGSVEVSIRVMFAMVLSDVLDLEWPAKLEQRLRETQDSRGLERMAFGTRVDMLRLALKLHAGASNRVLPDLQPWWSAAEGPLLELVQARNQVTHLAALEEADPTDARRRFAQFLSSARWLEQVQLIHVDRVSRERGRFATHLYRLRGVAPWNELSLELDTSFSAPLEGNSVYLGNAAGTAWALAPFFSARRRSVAVFDGLDKRGSPLFFDPTRPTAEALEATEGFPLPGEEWQLAAWPEFLNSRRKASAWRVSEPRPDALLQLPVTADVTLAPGTRLDYLELVEPLGEGGFATVWRAKDIHTGAQVAVKVLRADVASSERELVRFEEEVALLRRLHAQGCRRLIGPVEAFRTELGGDRRLVLKMPLLAGTVAQAAEALRSDGRAPTPEQVARWGLEALEALSDLHAHGVVHRDVKPSNLLLDADGHVVLADLGIARDLQRDARVTRTGEAVGSDLYMAPEQRRSSRPVTGKADLFALAGTLHELLTGEEPVLPGKGVPGQLGEALRRMATVDPEERPDAQEATRLIAATLGPRPPANTNAPRRLPIIAGLVVSGILVFGGVAFLPTEKLAPAVCGDGHRTGAEECDDGNTDEGDLCTAQCKWNVAMLPAGTFLMGYTEAELDAGMHLLTQSRRPPEWRELKARYATPAAQVQASPFGILKTEVSQAAYRRFVEDPGYGRLEELSYLRTEVSQRWHKELIDDVRQRSRADPLIWRGIGDNPLWPSLPTADGAAAFCAWLGGSIVTEAAWEYAARGRGDDRVYPWGNTPLTGAPEDCEKVTGFFGMSENPLRAFSCGGRRPTAVGSRRAGCTEDGVCDMAGNADEFVHPAPAVWTWEEVKGERRLISHHPGPIDGGAGTTSTHHLWITEAFEDPLGLRTGTVANLDSHLADYKGFKAVRFPREASMLVVRGGNFDDSMPTFYQARARWPYLSHDDHKGIRCQFDPRVLPSIVEPPKPPPRVTGCGDGVIQPPEVCDDGNRLDGDLCTAQCTSNLAALSGGLFEAGYSEQELDAGAHLVSASGRSEEELLRRAGWSTPSTPLEIYNWELMRTPVTAVAFNHFVVDDGDGALATLLAEDRVTPWRDLLRRVRARERRAPTGELWPNEVARVDTEAAAAFCRWLGATVTPEAVWEYAARDEGQARLFPWGDTPTHFGADCTRAGVCGLASGEPELVQPVPVTWRRELVEGMPRLVSHWTGRLDMSRGDTGRYQGWWSIRSVDDAFGILSGSVYSLDALFDQEPAPDKRLPRAEALWVLRGGKLAQARERWPFVKHDEQHAFRCAVLRPPR